MKTKSLSLQRSTFLFEVNDGTIYSTQQTITIDVTAVNDAPTSADNTVVATEDTVFTFASGDFPYTDVDSDPLDKLRLQAITAGTLWVDADGSGALDNGEVAVANNDEVAAADITKIKFLADLNDNGTAYATFQFEVNDATVYSSQHTMTVDVTAVNDTPTDIALDNDTIIEAKPIGTIVGNFSATDVDVGETFTYSLVAGTGDTGNASFSISGNQLQSAVIFNYATQNTYSIRVRVTDSGAATYEEVFTINIEQGGSLTINIYPPTGGTTTGEGDYTPGDTAIATATPAAGYIFAGWTGDVPGGANALDTPLSVLIDSNKTLNAYFTRMFYNVSVSVFPERHGYVTGGGSILAGSSITLTATELAAPDTVPFSHWRINGVDGSTNPTLNLTVNEAQSVEAVFDMGLPEEYVLVPAVEYTREKNNRNEHVAKISAFYMSSNETTKQDWYTVYNWAILNGYTFEFDPINANGSNLPHTDPQYLDDFPITGIYWNDMVKWCNARSEMDGFSPSYFSDASKSIVHRSLMFASEFDSLTNDQVDWRSRGYRLPTEVEWEWAARGGLTNQPYPNGASIDESQAFYNQPSTSSPISTATEHWRIANGYGLYDECSKRQCRTNPRANSMAGNSWEACWDWWSKYWYSNSFLGTNFRSLRGGSGHSDSVYTKVDTRFYAKIWDRFPVTIRPVFPAPSAQTATLRLAAHQAHLGNISGAGAYEVGSTAELVAHPVNGAYLKEWVDSQGNSLGNSSPLQLVISEDTTVYAVFKDTVLDVEMYTLYASAAEAGSGYIQGNGSYIAGSTVQITGIPVSGLYFAGWSGAVIGSDATTDVVVDNHKFASASFESAVGAVDTDGDGIADIIENSNGTDPNERDTDNDQIPDNVEINVYGSDPTLVDTDGDGYDDRIEALFNTSLTDPEDHPFLSDLGLLVYYPFDGNTRDLSSNAYHGIATSVSFNSDRFQRDQKALSFNGNSSYVEASGLYGISGSSARTISGWVQANTGDSGPILAYGSSDNAFSINVNTVGNLQVIAGTATISGTTNIADAMASFSDYSTRRCSRIGHYHLH